MKRRTFRRCMPIRAPAIPAGPAARCVELLVLLSPILIEALIELRRRRHSPPPICQVVPKRFRRMLQPKSRGR
jgi:hypothetical protein